MSWCLSLKEELKPCVFEDRVLRTILGPMMEKHEQRVGENIIMRSFIIFLAS
jgi:hypothetical protein